MNQTVDRYPFANLFLETESTLLVEPEHRPIICRLIQAVGEPSWFLQVWRLSPSHYLELFAKALFSTKPARCPIHGKHGASLRVTLTSLEPMSEIHLP